MSSRDPSVLESPVDGLADGADSVSLDPVRGLADGNELSLLVLPLIDGEEVSLSLVLPFTEPDEPSLPLGDGDELLLSVFALADGDEVSLGALALGLT